MLYTLLEGIATVATALAPRFPLGRPKYFDSGCADGLHSAATGKIGELDGATRFRPMEPKPVFPRLELPPKRFVISIDAESGSKFGFPKANLKLINGSLAYLVSDHEDVAEAESALSAWRTKNKKQGDLVQRARVDEKPEVKSSN